jgi:hypothetical protein
MQCRLGIGRRAAEEYGINFGKMDMSFKAVIGSSGLVADL